MFSAFLDFFCSMRVKYPKNGQNLNIHGKVVAQFYIDNSGKLKGFYIAKSVHPEFDEEAKRVIFSYKKWPIPRYKGNNIHLLLYQPVNFVLP